eukprot:847269-Pyramimonas_sp.AAC.1
MPAMLRQEKPQGAKNRAKAVERAKARAKEMDKTNHAGCSPRQDLAHEVKIVGSQRTRQTTRGDGTALAYYWPVPR